MFLDAIIVYMTEWRWYFDRRRMEKRTKLEPEAGVGRRIAVVLAFVALAVTVPILISYLTTRGYVAMGPHFERIEFRGSSTTRSTDSYFVTISFANTGDRGTEIDSVLLNGVSWDDPGWTGTIKPLVFGDIAPGTAIDAGASCYGLIVFSGDCEDPGGRKLVVDIEYNYLRITIHSTGGKDYETTVTIARGPMMGIWILAAAMFVAAASVSLLVIMARRARARCFTQAHALLGFLPALSDRLLPDLHAGIKHFPTASNENP